MLFCKLQCVDRSKQFAAKVPLFLFIHDNFYASIYLKLSAKQAGYKHRCLSLFFGSIKNSALPVRHNLAALFVSGSRIWNFPASLRSISSIMGYGSDFMLMSEQVMISAIHSLFHLRLSQDNAATLTSLFANSWCSFAMSPSSVRLAAKDLPG